MCFYVFPELCMTLIVSIHLPSALSVAYSATQTTRFADDTVLAPAAFNLFSTCKSLFLGLLHHVPNVLPHHEMTSILIFVYVLMASVCCMDKPIGCFKYFRKVRNKYQAIACIYRYSYQQACRVREGRMSRTCRYKTNNHAPRSLLPLPVFKKCVRWYQKSTRYCTVSRYRETHFRPLFITTHYVSYGSSRRRKIILCLLKNRQYHNKACLLASLIEQKRILKLKKQRSILREEHNVYY